MTIFLRMGTFLVLLQALQAFFKGFSPVYEATALSGGATPLTVTLVFYSIYRVSQDLSAAKA